MAAFQIHYLFLNIFNSPFCRDCNSKGGGQLVHVKQGTVAKRLKNLETKICDTICIEVFPRINGMFYLHIDLKNKIILYFLKRYQAA